MPLDPRTEAAMRDFFVGHVCHHCGFPAQRWSCNKFWCHDCVVADRNKQPLILRPVKAPRELTLSRK